MAESKPYRTPDDNEWNIPTDGNKGQAYKPKKYRGKKPRKDPSPETKAETNFQGQCTDLEGYIFDLGKRVPDKFSQIIKEMEQYLGTTYSDIFQPAIMTETLAALPDPEMPNIPDLGI